MLISYSNHYFKYLYWVPKPLIGYFEEALHVGIAELGLLVRLPNTPMDYFKTNLHVDIASRPWSSFKGTQITYWLCRNDPTCGYCV